MRHPGADPEKPPAGVYHVQGGNACNIDQGFRSTDAALDLQDQIGAAGDDPTGVTMARQERQSLR
jgi:hypothetical protein